MKALKELIVRLYPTEATALMVPGKPDISYQQLVESFKKISTQLADLGIKPGDRIGICSASKSDTIIVIGACLMADMIYVPMEAHQAVSRNCAIITSNGLRAILFDPLITVSYEQHISVDSRSTILNLDFIGLALESQNEIIIHPDLAFILNTSGSTGMPKGVMITHQNAWSFIQWTTRQYRFLTSDRFASIAPLHFDLSVFDVFVALHTQATLVLFDASMAKNPLILAQYISEFQISILYSTPSLLSSLVDFGKLSNHTYLRLRYIFFAGEPYPIEKFKQLHTQIPHASYSNWYGPTETNVVTYYNMPIDVQTMTQSIPIGKTCAHMDSLMKQDPDSNLSELLICGPSVSPGYFNSRNLTDQSFILVDGRNWYKTGDLVTIDENGDYIFHGRKDRMVKRRGYRIELDELQHHFCTYPGVIQGAIVAKTRDNLVVIYAVYKSIQLNSLLDIRNFMLDRLPLYMIPDHFIRRDALPLTSTGKIDLQVLISSI